MRASLASLSLAGLLLGCPQDVTPLRDAAVDAGASANAGAGRDAGVVSLPDARPAEDAGGPDSGLIADAGPVPDAGPRPDGGFVPNAACEPEVLPCLDPAQPDVYSVPDEITWSEAQAQVQANQTIQVRGLRVGAGVRVPPAVTLHGCEGAEIIGEIAFEGLGGRVQGFRVTGGIVANQTGTYVVRRNHFLGESATYPGVSARSVDALVSAVVDVVIEQNRFEGRQHGVELATRYDTMQHEVTARIVNNVFDGTPAPVLISEAGLVGVIRAEVEHNTFHDFDDAVRISGAMRPTPLVANLFANGNRAVAGTAPFTVQYVLLDGVDNDSQTPPFSGVFVHGQAGFVDAAGGDFRLTAGSDALDLVPESAASARLDFAGCPRPEPYVGARNSDIGAFEAQP